ncbi:cation:proton antiporter [Streptomyces sp. NBC_00190]|uniref:cation:proton antiporter n=1 Tax=unclassified Streptomyces TaxID=2593676 RepID=UPI002E2CA520|nr:cation:proton antiporter [Streptomyces sp. NBC_00190]WSZ43844.1 cation:proton antiporter [Streptomyces sp. NBC_00868]
MNRFNGALADPVTAAAAPPASVGTGGVLLGLAVLLAVAYVFSRLAQRFHQPVVMGEIVAGIALGPSLLGLLPGDLSHLFFPPAVRPFLQVIAQLGLVLFMFGVGYRLEIAHLRGAGRQVTAVSLGSVTLPFLLGMGLAAVLAPWFITSELGTEGLLEPALFMGVAMSITAFPVLARIIDERGLNKSRLGSIALTCAAIQDFLAWCVLAVVVALVHATGAGSLAWMAVEAAAFVLGLLYVVRPALRWLLAPERRWAGGPVTHAALVIGLLMCAWATEEIGLHAVFGAFAFGAVVPRRHIDALAPEVPERIEQTSLFLLPAFFTVTGLSVNLGGLGWQGALMLLAAVAVACAGKFVGAFGAAVLTGASARESTALGVLLNARGLTELVILNVGLSLKVLDSRMFTAMVFMAVITTIMTGPLLHRIHPLEGRPSTRERSPDPVGAKR